MPTEFTTTFGDMLKRLYSADMVQDLIADEKPFFQRIKKEDAIRIGDCVEPGWYPPKASSPVATAAVVVVTSVMALEWLRQRKAAVAAAEQDEAAFASLLEDFVAWLRRVLDMLGMRKAAE